MLTCLVVDEHGDREIVEFIVNNGIELDENKGISITYSSFNEDLYKNYVFDMCLVFFFAHSALRADFGNIRPFFRGRLVVRLMYRCPV